MLMRDRNVATDSMTLALSMLPLMHNDYCLLIFNYPLSFCCWVWPFYDSIINLIFKSSGASRGPDVAPSHGKTVRSPLSSQGRFRSLIVSLGDSLWWQQITSIAACCSASSTPHTRKTHVRLNDHSARVHSHMTRLCAPVWLWYASRLLHLLATACSLLRPAYIQTVIEVLSVGYFFTKFSPRA